MRNLAVGVVGLLSLTLVRAENEWSRFRGPNGSGVSADAAIPAAPAEKNILWRTELPGTGHGSPSVWGDGVYLCAGDEATAERWVLRVNANDGAVVWKKSFPSAPHAMHKFNNYGTCTPAVDATGLVTYWATDREITVAAFSHDGGLQWKRDLGAFDSDHGGGTSPLILDGLVIVGNDQRGTSSLIALDRATGADRWVIPRKSDPKGTGYGLPCLYTEPGQKPQLVFAARANGMTGVDPATGRVLWEMDLFQHRVVACPVVAGDLVLVSAGEGGGGKRMVAVKPGAFDGSRPPALKYELTKTIPYVPTILVAHGLGFMPVDGSGMGVCFNPATGDIHWQDRLGSGFFGSMVCAGQTVHVLDKNGDLLSFPAAATYTAPSRLSLGETAYSTPAIANGKLFCRTVKHLIALGASAAP